MLTESLPEYLAIARFCITNPKSPLNGFQEGVYGYPGALLLFTVADIIGSFYKNDANFLIKIDRKDKKINSVDKTHFYILNSSYYGLNLSEHDIQKIYDNFRSTLTHNGSLPPNHWLNANPADESFSFKDGKPTVNLVPFLELSEQAVKKFLTNIKGLTSNTYDNIEKKIW